MKCFIIALFAAVLSWAFGIENIMLCALGFAALVAAGVTGTLAIAAVADNR